MKENSENFIDKKNRLKKLFSMHPFEWGRLFGTAWATFIYRFIFRCIGPKTIVGPKAQLINFSRIKIGAKSLILDNVYMRAGMQGIIKIGDGVAINSFAKIFAHGGVEIGNYTQLGPGALITTTAHDYEDGMDTNFKRVKIGQWVWIGANAIILPGTTIGDYCVIGAGSIVTKDLPPYSVAVGNPAKVIRENETAKNKNGER